jgi:4-hydroxyphenylacetate 3-monooxygenase
MEGPGGSLIPRIENAVLIRLFGTRAFPAARDVYAETLGGAPLVTPSSVEDMKSEELGPLIDRFYRGSTGDAHDRVKLFKLIWDAMGSEFGSRHEWYEINYSGNQEQMRLDMLRFSGGRGIMDSADELVERCMSEYDEGRLRGRHLGESGRLTARAGSGCYGTRTVQRRCYAPATRERLAVGRP